MTLQLFISSILSNMFNIFINLLPMLIALFSKIICYSRGNTNCDPTFTLPDPPPPCNEDCDHHQCTGDRKTWWNKFKVTVDDLLLCSNQHVHMVDKNGNNMS